MPLSDWCGAGWRPQVRDKCDLRQWDRPVVEEKASALKEIRALAFFWCEQPVSVLAHQNPGTMLNCVIHPLPGLEKGFTISMPNMK